MSIELTELPEPVMAQFDRLPLPMQMRVAAEVLRKVNQRCVSNGRRDAAHENWWPSKLAGYATLFDREDYDAATIAAGLADGLDLT
jgi:hypothetical protein